MWRFLRVHGAMPLETDKVPSQFLWELAATALWSRKLPWLRRSSSK